MDVAQVDLIVLGTARNKLEVLQDLDLASFRPKYILFEASSSSPAVYYLKEHSYDKVIDIENNIDGKRFMLWYSRSQSGEVDLVLKKIEKAWDIAARSNASSPGKYVACY